MAVVGFDLGTTNSLISVVQGDRVVSLTDDQGLAIPSVVSYEGSRVLVGQDARERLSEAGLGIHGSIVRSPKRHLGQEHIFVGGVQRSPVDVVRDVVAYVRLEAMNSKTVRGLTIDKAVATIPVNMIGARRAALRDAFRMAGIGVVQFVHEPLAALYAHFRSSGDYAGMLRRYDRQLVAVFDWGGGTLDITLCRLLNGTLVQVANDGTDEVGGDIFDTDIRNEIVSRVRRQRGLGDDVRESEDAWARLMHKCEVAKIDLSGRETARVFVPDFFMGADDADLNYPLSRDELESMVAPLLGKGLGRLTNLLRSTGYTPASVSFCLATGGMANMPAVKVGLHQLFGPERVNVSPRSATLISEGAAWVAHDKARLKLAKSVELLLARNSHLPLIKAGTELPTEGLECKEDFSLYCADPRDGLAKFQFVMPVSASEKVFQHDPRRQLETLTVKVDPQARPLSERLALQVRVDHNLILRADALSMNKRDCDSAEIHDLEFSLGLPHAPMKSDSVSHDLNEQPSTTEAAFERGALVVRSNVAMNQQEINVPGELMYEVSPHYFDRRREPPEIQDEERLYYTPCSICQRASNDPLCKCATRRS